MLNIRYSNTLKKDYQAILKRGLLIYKIEQDILTLSLTRTGTHSDLF